MDLTADDVETVARMKLGRLTGQFLLRQISPNGWLAFDSVSGGCARAVAIGLYPNGLSAGPVHSVYTGDV